MPGLSFFCQCKKTDNGEVIFYFESVGLVLYNIYYSVPQRNHYKCHTKCVDLFFFIQYVFNSLHAIPKSI